MRRKQVEVVHRGGRPPERAQEELDGIPVEVDEHGVPKLRGVSDKIATLERRRHYLERRVQEGRGSKNAQDLDRLEVGALFAAQVALTYHRNAIQRLDEPLGLLAEVVGAYDGPVDQEGRMRALINRARLLLEEWPGMVRKT